MATSGSDAGGIVWADGLCKKYGKTEALSQLSFSVDEGEIYGIYNPQNEMFWHFRTKCSFSKTKRTSLTLFSINHIQ